MAVEEASFNTSMLWISLGAMSLIEYRGEIMVLLINFSQEDFVINDGERIAQMVLAKHEQCDFIEVEELDETERGAGGYGHTGVK